MDAQSASILATMMSAKNTDNPVFEETPVFRDLGVSVLNTWIHVFMRQDGDEQEFCLQGDVVHRLVATAPFEVRAGVLTFRSRSRSEIRYEIDFGALPLVGLGSTRFECKIHLSGHGPAVLHQTGSLYNDQNRDALCGKGAEGLSVKIPPSMGTPYEQVVRIYKGEFVTISS